MITNIMQKPIPACLGHHTSFKDLCSILTSGIGKDKEICFWAFSNMHKNDEEEIELGLKLQAIVDAEMRKISDKSIKECEVFVYKKNNRVYAYFDKEHCNP